MSSEPRYQRSQLHSERSKLTIPGGVNSNVRLISEPCPLTITRGEGSHIWDVDNNQYLDFAMGMGPHILGHAPKAVISAVRQSLDEGQLFAGQNLYEVELAELFVSLLPWIEQIRIGLSGTEMNLLAVRIARAHTGKQKIIRFAGHYHGWLDPLFVNPSSVDSGAENYLTSGQSKAAVNDILLAQWNDIDSLTNLVNHESDIAAMIMEPMMCNTGCIEPSAGYLEYVKNLCKSHGIILIIDEVITGFRIGIEGAQGRFKIHGDISVYAKAIGAGFPIAILGSSTELLREVGTGKINHSGTYNAGVSSTVAALATLTELKRTDPFEKIQSTGLKLMGQLSELRTKDGKQLNADGTGHLFQLRFGTKTQPTNLTEYRENSDAETLKKFISVWQRLGVRTTSRGMCFLSAAHTQIDVDFAAEKAAEAISEI
jgi:glutamate-1-semialdehyde 2,1-aminomutase